MKPESKIVRQIKSIFGTWETLGEYPDTFQGLTDAKIDLKLTRKEWGEGLGGGRRHPDTAGPMPVLRHQGLTFYKSSSSLVAR